MKKAIIVGASSGIGKELALLLSEEGYEVGLAARQIFKAISAGKRKAYVTRRWALIAWLLKILPDFIYNKL